MKTFVRDDNFCLKDQYLKSSCANFSEALKVIYNIRWPYVPACQGKSQCAPVAPAKLLIVPPFHSQNRPSLSGK